MNEKILKDVIADFQIDKFARFFRAKNSKFRFPHQPLFCEEDNFKEATKIAEANLEDGNLIVCSFLVQQPLSERSGKKAQYELGKKILKENQADAGIFIFYDVKGSFRFSLIYANYLGTYRDWSSFKRFTYLVSPELTNKTFLEQIGEGDFSTLETIKKAFSVEPVTKQFYQEIANWYFWAVQESKFPEEVEKEENGRNISIIRLITRIIFIWFMREQNLISPKLFDYREVSNLLNDLSANSSTFYKAILQNLFFATLNTKTKDRKFRFQKTFQGKNQDYMDHTVYRYEKYFKNKEEAIILFKDIPFLNGGLFNCLDKRITENGINKEIRIDGFTDKEVGLNVPNFLFFSDEKNVDLNKEYGTKNKKYKVQGLVNILSSYNFTIDENVPDDQEVALDPELLGKVFENLLASYNPETTSTARKATGSYYTPREIVDYMVSESLKEYFKTHLIDIETLDKKLDNLFSTQNQENPFTEQETRKIIGLIDDLRIVDPAVGSGAFPMGILNKLVFILSKLDSDNKLWKEAQLNALDKSITDPLLKNKLKEQTIKQFAEKNSDYGRKLYLIQKSIYGVDVQQVAVEIAKLRFFISLLVDEKIDKSKENWGIEPLPNLDFKIMQGNSLISEFMGINLDEDEKQSDNGLFEDETRKLVKNFQNRKNEFQNEPDKNKKDALMQEINGLIIKIFEAKLKIQKVDYFRKIREIEEKYSQLPNEKQRKEMIEKEKQSLYEKEGFNLKSAEKQLKEFTEGRKIKPFFAWKLYFAEVFQEKGGFDVVIANPPYIDSELMVNLGQMYIRSTIQKTYTMAKGNWDIYIAFFELGLRVLNKFGILTFITPDKWISKPFGDALRKNTIGNIYSIVRSGRSIFDVSNVDSIISFLSKRKHQELKIIDEKFTLKRLIDKKILKPPFTLDHLFSDYLDLLNKIDTLPSKVFELDSCENACATSDAYKLGYIIKDLQGRFDKSKHLKIINTGTIGRYSSKWGKRQMTYLGRKYLYPIVNKNEFFHLFRNTYSQKAVQAKILIKGLNLLDACLDLDGSIVPGKSTLIIIDNDIIKLKFLLSIINSKLAFFYLRERYPASSYNLGTNFTKKMIDNLPLPRVNDNEQKLFIDLVDKILAITKDEDYLENPAKQAKVKEYERQIDLLVYELYGLTEEEIKIIEGINYGK